MVPNYQEKKVKFISGTTSDPSRRITESKLMCGPNSLKSHLKITLSSLRNYCKLDWRKITPEEVYNVNNC